jgi:RNA polymerase sigma-70 factor, ECF subfamily
MEGAARSMKEGGPANDLPERLDAETLFREHGRFVAGFIARLGMQGQDVDDLVQDVFLLVHRQGGFVSGAARPTTWLAAIALRVTMAARRGRRRTPLLPDAEQVERLAGATTPHEELAQARAVRATQNALASIDLERRAIFLLYELEGESCEALARSFGIPIGTVYSRLHTARDEFLHAYGRETGQDVSAWQHGGGR